MSDCIEGYHRSYRRIAELVRKLASALDDSHAQGIVHRDVKPHNVMIDGDGELHLMDFGVAHAGDAAEKRTHDGAIIGTSVYMFPEQAGGGSANVTSDSNQYRLGAILFELLTGQKSFDGIDGDAITRLWLTGATSEVQRPPDRQTVDCKGKQWERCLHRDIEPRDRRRKLPLRLADSSAE